MITTNTLLHLLYPLLFFLTHPTAHAADTPFLGYPSPWAYPATPPNPGGDPIPDKSWAEAYAQAVAFVAELTLTEKVNLTTGTGWEADRCIGNTGGVPRVGFRGLCLEDGPLGVRNSKYIHSPFSFRSGLGLLLGWWSGARCGVVLWIRAG